MARNEADAFVRNSGARGNAKAPGSLDSLIDDWLDLLGRELPPASSSGGAASIAAERGTRRVAEGDATSLVVAFDDAAGGTVDLLRAGGRFVHRGVVAPRGPAAPAWDARRALGLNEAQTCAIDFVADWFGAPFDAVNVTRPSPDRLTWGIWNFSGERLARCLGRWKGRAPETFAALVSSAGIDVEPAPDGVAAANPTLTLIDGRGALVRGAHLEGAAAGDPRFVAVLARAGRHVDGQLAQIDSLAHDILEPAIASAHDAESDGSGPEEVVRTARGLAALLYLDLRLGAKSMRQILRAVIGDPPRFREESAVLDALVERLRAGGRPVDAHNVLRIMSSPELDRR